MLVRLSLCLPSCFFLVLGYYEALLMQESDHAEAKI